MKKKVKFFNFLQLLRHILRVYPSWGEGGNFNICGLVHGDNRNCSVKKCGAWVGIKLYHNRNWQVGSMSVCPI